MRRDWLGGGERIILGGPFGEEPAERSCERLNLFRALGGRVLDTAHSYADGRSEKVLGDWLRRHACRDEFLIVDKFCHPAPDGTSRVRPALLRRELNESLRRLQTSHVDVLMMHRDDPSLPVEDLVGAMLREVESGRARGIGVSNWPSVRLARFIELAHQSACPVVASYQFSLAVPCRPIWPGALHADAPILQVLRTTGTPLLAWAAQARGWFAEGVGEGDVDAPFESPLNREARLRCQHLAARHNAAPATVALAWTLGLSIQVWPIVGPRTKEELVISLAGGRLRLTSAELRFLAGERSAWLPR